MYRKINDGQFSIYPLLRQSSEEDNRWIQFRNMIDRRMIDEEYSRHFKNKAAGQEVFPSSVTFG